MIFYIARPLNRIRMCRTTLKFAKQCAERFGHHIGQDIQPTPMRHADDNFLNTQVTPTFDNLLKRRHNGLSTIKPKPLGAGIFNVDKFL